MTPDKAEKIPEEKMEAIADEILEGDVMEDEELDSDMLDDEAEPAPRSKTHVPDMTKDEQLKVLEAVLFAASEPLSPKTLHERLPEEADLNVLLQDLKAQYEGRGVSLIEVDGHWAFRTSSEIADILTIEKDVNKKMSRAMLETMAIIAYHQPLTRAEIENIRGVATHRGTLDTLMEMEWVKPGRRRETPGRPLTWVTTTKFLDHFQLEQINDLPGLEDLKASGLLDKRPAIDTIPDTGDLFDSADQSAEEMLAEQEKRDQMDSDDRFEDDITNDIISGSNDLGEEEDL